MHQNYKCGFLIVIVLMYFNQLTLCHTLMMVVDVLVIFLFRFINTLALIRYNPPNDPYTMRFTNLKLLILKRKTVIQPLKKCGMFSSLNLQDNEFHAVQRYCKVTQEVPREQLFVFEGEESVI